LVKLEVDAMARRVTGLKPGVKVPASGQYREIGPRGGRRREVTSVKGEKLPPTSTKGSTYKLVDRTRNKSGGG
jgi:YjzC-like protein